MIKVFIPTDVEFSLYKTQLKSLYENLQNKITDTNSFEFIRDNTLFYGFVKFDNDRTTVLGGIYYFKLGEKLFVNAFASRNHHLENLECFKLSLTWFNCDIYAEAQNRMSAQCLLKCGFKRLKGKLFVLRRG